MPAVTGTTRPWALIAIALTQSVSRSKRLSTSPAPSSSHAPQRGVAASGDLAGLTPPTTPPGGLVAATEHVEHVGNLVDPWWDRF